MASWARRVLESPWTGVVGVGVVISGGVIGFVGPPPIGGGSTISPDQWVWVKWTIVAAAFFTTQAFWALLKQNRDFAARLRPGIDLFVGSPERPFQQDSEG